MGHISPRTHTSLTRAQLTRVSAQRRQTSANGTPSMTMSSTASVGMALGWVSSDDFETKLRKKKKNVEKS